MADIHEFADGGLGGPYDNAAPITPHDTNDLAYVTCAIQAADAETITVITKGGETVALEFAAGQLMPIRATRIKATGTDVTGITALW